MALNIKNEQVVALAREISELTGESLTDAVRVALEERRAQLQRTSTNEELRVARLWQLAEQLGRELGPLDVGMTTDDLYDPETGLPA